MRILKSTPIMTSVALMLAACGSTTVTPTIPRLPPPALTVPCPDLLAALDGKLSTILQNSLERAELYYTCQARHRALSEWAQPLPDRQK